MSDLPDTHVNSNPEMQGEVLRQRFILLARCAAESSNDASDETVIAATMMVDLLSVAAMFRDDSASSERAAEIIEFCHRRALPVLMETDSEAGRKSLLQDAKERWSDCLTLLSPEERFVSRQPSGWIDENTDGWNETLRADVRDNLLAANEASVFVDEDSQQRPVDMTEILASLECRDDSSDGQAPCPADSGHRDVTPNPNPYKSGNVASEAGDTLLPAPPTELETIDDPEMVAAYADDAHQCIADMESSLLSLESGQNSNGALRVFCRQLHTLKGASGTVGLSRLARYLHDLESWIEKTDHSRIDIDKLLDCVDTVRAQLSALGISSASATLSAATVSKPDTAPQVVRQSASPSPVQGGDNEFFVRVEASRLERLMDLLAELVMLRNRRDTYGESLRYIHRELNYCAARTRALTSSIEFTGSAAESSGETSPGADAGRATARSRLLSRTLDEVSKDTAELGRSLKEVFDPLSDDNSAVSHLIGQFRQELMELRRLPIGGLFQRLQRVIREAAKSEGKLVEVNFEGQGARAERAMQERLFEPLLHLVRNAVSHGLDTPDARTRTGKSSVGRITLAAWSDGASLCIEVRDDGRGLNDEALETKGRELGLLPRGESVSRQQLWKLIFHPGFSTKSAVSEISGRGVGMDVVDSWVKRLRGRIDVESVPGQGTTFRLHIPLRSAVEHAMVVRAGGQLFALPMHAVSGTSDSKRPANTSAKFTSEKRTVTLSRILGCKASQTTRGCCISLRNTAGTPQNKTSNVGSDVTIAVDAIIGVEEVVVRSLPSLLQRNELFAGVTLSGRAETVLLLDVRKVLDLCHGAEPSDDKDHDSVSTGGESLTSVGNDHMVLVVDDSVVVRRSLSRKLRTAGCQVREATNGREAMDVLNAGGITAVITDLDMPRMTGIELLQEMKRQKQFRTIPVTVLTSRDDESTLSEVRQLQPAAVLNKPVTDGTVKAIIDSLNLFRCPDFLKNICPFRVPCPERSRLCQRQQFLSSTTAPRFAKWWTAI